MISQNALGFCSCLHITWGFLHLLIMSSSSDERGYICLFPIRDRKVFNISLLSIMLDVFFFTCTSSRKFPCTFSLETVFIMRSVEFYPMAT